MLVNTTLRSYTIVRNGHFDAAHHLPRYLGKCQEVHGHRWEVQAQIHYHMLDVGLVRDPSSDGILIDFADISEIWEELDHTNLNDVFADPTAEIIASWLLDSLAALVATNGPDAPFEATIVLSESPDSSITVSLYHELPGGHQKDYPLVVAGYKIDPNPKAEPTFGDRTAVFGNPHGYATEQEMEVPS